MTGNIALPKDLISAIGSENKDFAVKAERAQSLTKSFLTILFGTGWAAFTSIFVFGFFGPLFQGKEVHFESNGVPVVASPDHLGPILMPTAIIGVFVLIGIGMLSWGIYSIFKKGGYFVGTPTRLVQYQNGNIRSIDWEQFSGDIEVNGNAQKGNIALQMRSRGYHSGIQENVSDVIDIAGIPNVFEIGQICRKRIKENDPTPPATECDIA